MRGAIRQVISGNQGDMGHLMRGAIGRALRCTQRSTQRCTQRSTQRCTQSSHIRQLMATGTSATRQSKRSSTSASTCSKSGRVLPARKCSRRRRASPTAACNRDSRAVGASTATTTAPSPPQASVNAAIAAAPSEIAACSRSRQSRGEEGLRRCNLGASSHLLALEAISTDIPGGERRGNVPQTEGRAAHHGATDRLHRLVKGR